MSIFVENLKEDEKKALRQVLKELSVMKNRVVMTLPAVVGPINKNTRVSKKGPEPVKIIFVPKRYVNKNKYWFNFLSIHEYISMQPGELVISKYDFQYVDRHKLMSVYLWKSYKRLFDSIINSRKCVVPRGTKYSDIAVEYLSETDVKIYINNRMLCRTDYKEMGFCDKRNGEPTKQWELLKLLITAKYNAIGWKHTLANPNFKKQKSILSKQLKEYFSLSEDPFDPYKENSEYRLKINEKIQENKTFSNTNGQ